MCPRQRLSEQIFVARIRDSGSPCRFPSRAFMLEHERVDPLAVPVICKCEEVIGPFAVLLGHLAPRLHMGAEHVNQFLIRPADLPESHRVVEKGSVFVVLRNLVVVQIDDWLPHVRKVKLDAGEVRDHQRRLAEKFLVTHLAGGGDDLDQVIFRKIVVLRADDRVQHVLNAVAVFLRGIQKPRVIHEAVVHPEVAGLLEVRVVIARDALTFCDRHG